MKKERTKSRSKYKNKKSYDDELDLVLDLLEAEKPIENQMNEELNRLFKKLEGLYQRNLPFYFKDGIKTKELKNLIESLSKNKVSNTDIAKTLDELKRDVRTLQNNYLTAWLIIDYEMTVKKTATSLSLTYNSPTVMSLLDIDKKIQIIKEPWCEDKKNFLDRINKATEDMDTQLRQIIVQGLQRGWSVERMSTMFQEITGVAAYKAKRLIRTETMAVYSKVTKEMFLEEGIEYVEIIGDAVCGGICVDYVGEIIPLKEAELGDDLPPYHPNCCCSFCSFTEFDEKEISEDETE